jgi:thioredoxin-like negative regulator of GroEL
VGGVQSPSQHPAGPPPARHALGSWLRVALVGLVASLWVGCANSSAEDTQAEFELHLHEGHLALETGEPMEAADAYRRALWLRPEAPEPLHGIARCHSARGDGRSALTVLMRLKTEHPAYARTQAAADLRFALYQAAKQELWAGDSARALKLCARLALLEPGHAGLAELRAEALLREAARLYVGGRLPEAESHIAVLAGRPLGGVEAAAALAARLIQRGHAELAISVLSDAMRQHGEQPRLRALMDRALDIRYPNTLPVLEDEPEVADPEPPPQRGAS